MRQQHFDAVPPSPIAAARDGVIARASATSRTGTCRRPMFHLGVVTLKPGAREVFEQARRSPIDFVMRHVHGDFGAVDDDRKAGNHRASATETGQVLSRFHVGDSWVEVLTDFGNACTVVALVAHVGGH